MHLLTIHVLIIARLSNTLPLLLLLKCMIELLTGMSHYSVTVAQCHRIRNNLKLLSTHWFFPLYLTLCLVHLISRVTVSLLNIVISLVNGVRRW